MSRRRTLAVLSLCGLLLLAGCLGIAPESDQTPTPAVAYEPFDVTVTEPANQSANRTVSLEVSATLATDHPDFLVPTGGVATVRNVSLSVSPATAVRGEATRAVGSLSPGETAVWNVAVCPPVDNSTVIRAVVDGTVHTEDGPADLRRGWAQSTATVNLSSSVSADDRSSSGC